MVRQPFIIFLETQPSVEFWLWNPCCGILTVESWLGGIWEASGDIWEASGRHLGQASLAELAKAGLEVKSKKNQCVFMHFSSRPTISCESGEGRCQKTW